MMEFVPIVETPCFDYRNIVFRWSEQIIVLLYEFLFPFPSDDDVLRIVHFYCNFCANIQKYGDSTAKSPFFDF